MLTLLSRSRCLCRFKKNWSAYTYTMAVELNGLLIKVGLGSWSGVDVYPLDCYEY